MKGPQGSLFEPSEYVIDAKKGQKCEDLAFKLKGFSLKFGVKSLNQEGKHVSGPSGLKIELKRQGKTGTVTQQDSQTTNGQGQVEFKDISIPTKYILSVVGNEDLTFKKESIECDFLWETGFKCQSDFFEITGFSVTG